MNRLLLTFYGDDFTGSTDALEQLSAFGLRSVLFLDPPTRKQLEQFPGLHACGVAGLTRSLTPAKMEKVLRPAFAQLKRLGARQVHYKVCSTFDSSPNVGNLGTVMEIAAEIFPARFIPLLVAAPALGRYTLFGDHFARYGIGSAGAIYRLDRHPAISRHPVTPMTEASLARHLARQTSRRVALFDILQHAQPTDELRRAFRRLVATRPAIILFDALEEAQLQTIGNLLADQARGRALFSVGSSGVETALASHWQANGEIDYPAPPLPSARRAANLLVGSGSCSPVTGEQIRHALRHGFAEVPLHVAKLADPKWAEAEINRAVAAAVLLFRRRRGVIVHTTKSGAARRWSGKLSERTGPVLGTALGTILRRITATVPVSRLCIAGGDTSSYAARALGITALELKCRLTPGAPLCRAHAAGSPVDDLETVFKGGQVGPENYFSLVLKGIS